MIVAILQKIKITDESERGELKNWLNIQHSKNKDHGIWSHHFMQIDGETMETVRDFVSGGSQITTDGDHSHEIKNWPLEEKLWAT